MLQSENTENRDDFYKTMKNIKIFNKKKKTICGYC